jgi:predicted nucleic acid-binding protein
LVKFVYWDTSCILALYLPEAISDQVAKLVSEENEILTSSAILEYEMTFALCAKEARGEVSTGTAPTLLAKFHSDLQRGRFLLAPLGQDVKNRARELAATALQSSPPAFLRTLDGIHLATALQLGSRALITADKRMADAAIMLGLVTRYLTPPVS